MIKKGEKKGTGARPRILVVDDENDLCCLFERILESEGYEVITANDGLGGIKRNNDSDPDLIILDLKMPKMDGIETLRNIRKTDKEVVVIILTGYGSAQTAREAQDLDVYEYISKPFNNELVRKVVKEALASGRER